MSRRPFDSSFSRRPAAAGGGGHQRQKEQQPIYSLMGDPPGQLNPRAYGGGSGGGRAVYEDDEYYETHHHNNQTVSHGYAEDEYEQPRQEFERVSRDGGQRARLLELEFSGSVGGGGKGSANGDGRSGGWRQRSPSPRYSSRPQESDRIARTPSWTRAQEVYDPFDDRNSRSVSHQQQQQQQTFQQHQQQVNPFATSSLQQDFQHSSVAASAVLRNQMGVGHGSSILGQPEQSVVMVLPHGQGAAGSLMGNLALNSNPFGVLGQQKPMQLIVGNLPSFATPSPFGQQVLQSTAAFGQNVGGGGQQQQTLNIYGPQTQQAFNRFDNSRNNSSGDSNRRSSTRGGNSLGVRRSGGGGGGDGGGGSRSSFGNKSSSVAGRSPSASDSTPRKRNLVLRDPRPDEMSNNKRARTSGGGVSPRGGSGNRQNNTKGSANRNSSGKPTLVKRISVGGADSANNKNNNRNRINRNRNRNSNKKVVDAKDAEKKTEVKKEPAGGPTADSDKNGEEESTKTTAEDDAVDNATKKNKDESGEKKESKKDRDKDKKTKYDDFPSSLLVCKVCQKVMNDGASFESHLNGRAHQSLMKILEERFAKRAELLMSESKCAEDEIGIEMERQRRAGKSGRNEKSANNYCKMCDCNYTVNWGTHKVSLGHRVLKEFLHPTCQFCKVHFMHRKDWVTHLLSSTHIKRLHEVKLEGSTPLDEQESPAQDELFAINLQLNRDERPTNTLTIRSLDGKESLTEEMKEILKNDRGEIVLPSGEIPIPETYDENTEIGEESIVAVSGSRCRVCRVYIAQDTEVEAHCKSKEHFNMYVSFLKRVVRHREHKEEERKLAEEKAKKEAERLQKEAERAEKKKLEAAAATAEKLKKDTEKVAVDEKATEKSSEEQATSVAKDSETAMETESTVVKGGESEQTKKVAENTVVAVDLSMDEADGSGSNAKNLEEVVEGNVNVAEQNEEDKSALKTGEKSEIVVDLTKPEVFIIDEDVEMTEVSEVTETPAETVVEDSTAVKESELLPGSPAKSHLPSETKLIDKDSDILAEADKTDLNTTSVVQVEETPETPSNKTVSSPTARRGGARGSAAGTGGSFRGGGRGAQALRNVTPRVDTNLRRGGAAGGSSANNRGQGRGGRANRSSPRGGGRGGPRGRGTFR